MTKRDMSFLIIGVVIGGIAFTVGFWLGLVA